MRTNFFLTLVAAFLLSGCLGLPDLGGNNKARSGGGILKSVDNGRTFEAKLVVDEETSLAGVNVSAIAFDPRNTSRLFIGSLQRGIYVSENAGEVWLKVDFALRLVSGIAVNPENSLVVYASGVRDGRAKVFRSDDGGAVWREVYVEPSAETRVSALAIDAVEPQKVFIGTDEGVFLQSPDGAQSWRTIFQADHEITDILFDAGDHNTIYARVGEREIIKSRDGGQTFEVISENFPEDARRPSFHSLAIDPQRSGVLYAGTRQGVFRSQDYGASWESINVIGSTLGIPIHALAVHPLNSDQITYAAGQAAYTSVSDAVSQWSISEGLPNHIVGEIAYDPFDPTRLYLGLRGGR